MKYFKVESQHASNFAIYRAHNINTLINRLYKGKRFVEFLKKCLKLIGGVLNGADILIYIIFRKFQKKTLIIDILSES